MPLRAWRETAAMLATASSGGYLLIGLGGILRTTALASPFTVSTSGLPVFFMCFMRPEELRLKVVRE